MSDGGLSEKTRGN